MVLGADALPRWLQAGIQSEGKPVATVDGSTC